MRLEKQELYCHNCNHYVQFDLDIEGDGNYIIECPECGHEHYRVVKDKQVTDERWGSSNGNWTTLNSNNGNVTVTFASTFNTYNGTQASINPAANLFLYNSWMNTTTSNTSISIGSSTWFIPTTSTP